MKVLIIAENLKDFFPIEDSLKIEFTISDFIHVHSVISAKDMLLNQSNFDLVLLGLKNLDQISESLVTQLLSSVGNIPLILLTEIAEKNLVTKFIALGISDYLLISEISTPLLWRTVYNSIERKRISSRLFESQALFEDLFKFSPLPKLIYSLETNRFVEVNIAAL